MLDGKGVLDSPLVFDTLGASLLGNSLADKEVIWDGDGAKLTSQRRGTTRSVQIFECCIIL